MQEFRSLALSKTMNVRLFQTERGLQTTISCLMKMAESSKQVKNTVGKGGITRYEQFLLFPQCFQKTCTSTTDM